MKYNTKITDVIGVRQLKLNYANDPLIIFIYEDCTVVL